MNKTLIKRIFSGRRRKFYLAAFVLLLVSGSVLAVSSGEFTVLIFSFTMYPSLILGFEYSERRAQKLSKQLQRTEKRVERTKAQLARVEKNLNTHPNDPQRGDTDSTVTHGSQMNREHVLELLRFLYPEDDWLYQCQVQSLKQMANLNLASKFFFHDSLKRLAGETKGQAFNDLGTLAKQLISTREIALVVDSLDNMGPHYSVIRPLVEQGRILVVLIERQQEHAQDTKIDLTVFRSIGLSEVALLPVQVGIRAFYPGNRLLNGG